MKGSHKSDKKLFLKSSHGLYREKRLLQKLLFLAEKRQQFLMNAHEILIFDVKLYLSKLQDFMNFQSFS